MPGARQFEALADKQVKFDWQELRRTFPVRGFAGLQHLFDGVEKAVGIEQHQLVEVTPLLVAYFAPLQSL
jgi:hypothetical protein